MKKLLLLLLPLQFAFADQNVTMNKITKDKTLDKYSVDLTLLNDGNLYGVKPLPNKTGAVIYKVSPTGKVTSLGNVPHPDILNYASSTISLAANKDGTLAIEYSFYNDQKKYQDVFYLYKNGTWTPLPDLLDVNIEYASNKLFIDDDETIHFVSVDNNSKILELKSGGNWTAMDNVAAQHNFSPDKIFNISNGYVYSSKKFVDPDSFTVYSFGADSSVSSGNIAANDGYEASCTIPLSANKVMTAFIYNHDNLAKKAVKFQTINLNQSVDSGTSKTVSNGSLIGSIFSLGKSVSSLVSSSSNKESADTPNATTSNEVDISSSLKDYTVKANNMQCANVNGVGYFVLTTHANKASYNTTSYVYFKVPIEQ